MAIAREAATAYMWRLSMPINRAVSTSSLQARMARPVPVLLRNSCRPTITAMPVPRMISWSQPTKMSSPMLKLRIPIVPTWRVRLSAENVSCNSCARTMATPNVARSGASPPIARARFSRPHWIV